MLLVHISAGNSPSASSGIVLLRKKSVFLHHPALNRSCFAALSGIRILAWTQILSEVINSDRIKRYSKVHWDDPFLHTSHEENMKEVWCLVFESFLLLSLCLKDYNDAGGL